MKRKFAFTLIEMLIAISVFAIGILAVLRVLTGNVSVLDNTNIKLQATVLAKEGIELLYNVRDSNLEKELPRNCVMNPTIYGMPTSQLNYFGQGDHNDPEEYICTGYFGTQKILQLSFDENSYLKGRLLDNSQDFDVLFQKNRLCLFSGNDMYWYDYCTNSSQYQEETIFARYLSFSNVLFNGQALSGEKILKVESHVLYSKLGNTGDVVFESFIGNY